MTRRLSRYEQAVQDQVWYRAHGLRYAPPLDEFDHPVGKGTCDVYIYEFRLIKTTEKGVWLDVFDRPRFVRTDARKKFACPSKVEALESFIARKHRQKTILRSQLEDVLSMEDIAAGMLEKEGIAR